MAKNKQFVAYNFVNMLIEKLSVYSEPTAILSHCQTPNCHAILISYSDLLHCHSPNCHAILRTYSDIVTLALTRQIFTLYYEFTMICHILYAARRVH